MSRIRAIGFGRRSPEIVLALIVVAGLANCVMRFAIDGKLPQPFIFDVTDTFMDWFNPAYYAHNRGAFEVWRTVYPPFAFVFLKIFGDGTCYVNDPYAARECDTVGQVAILGFYVLDVVLAYLSFRRLDRSTSVVRGVTFAISLPLLFTLERGNLILPSLVFFIVAHGGLAKSKWLRAVSLAVTINFKPYLVVPAFGWAVRRNWRLVELAAIATVLVYCLSYAVMGTGSPLELLHNVQDWVKFTGRQIFEQIYFSTSYVPFLEFDTYKFPARDLIPSTIFEPFMLAIRISTRASQAMMVVCLFGAWLQPRALSMARLSLLLVSIVLLSRSPGGYALIYIIFLLFLERWQRIGPILALTAGYLLCIPADYMIDEFITLYADSWLGHRPVASTFGISVGIFVRPGLLVMIFWSLAIDSLSLIVRAHRQHRPALGLAPPWRGDTRPQSA